MATDVRVRLSAEGEAQVVAALRKVAGEGQRAARTGTGGFSSFNRTLSGTKALLTQVAAVASVGVLVAYAKAGANAADAIGKASQRAGSSVKNFSALAFAAKTADVDFEKLQKTMAVFAKNVTALERGDKGARGVFGALGLKAADFAGKDAAERFALTAQALSKLKDSQEKATLAQAAFGKQGAALIPLFNDLEGGIEGALQKAEQFGVLLSDDTARAAQAINDDFTIIQAQLVAGAARFVEGLAPAVHAALTDVQGELGANQNAWKEWGARVGETVTIGALTVIATIDEIMTALRKLGNVAKLAGGFVASVFNPKLGATLIAETIALGAVNKKLDDDLSKRQDERLKKAEKIGEAIGKGIAGLPGLKGGVQDEDAAIVPDVGSSKATKDLEKERFDAVKRLEAERDRLIDHQLAAEGKRHEVAMRNIDDETEQLDRVLSELAQGPLTESDAAQVTAFRDALTRAEEFNKASEDTGDAFDQFSAERARVQDQVSAGLLTELEGKERILALDRERLPLLQAQAQALLAIALATKDPDAVAAAQETVDRLAAMSFNVQAATEVFGELRVAAKDALKGAIVDTLTRGIAEAQTFIQAVLAIGFAVAQAVQQILANKLAEQVLGGLSFLGLAKGGAVQRKAEGGPVYGAGTATSDSIPALLSNGEFVMRAAAVQRIGMATLQSMNGLGTSALSEFRGARRFADGGLVSGAGVARSESSLTVGLEKGLVVSELRTPEGEREVIRILQRNPRRTRSAIGS